LVETLEAALAPEFDILTTLWYLAPVTSDANTGSAQITSKRITASIADSLFIAFHLSNNSPFIYPR
jgi:hypothetical protein